jgi:hypothetical protein
MSSPTHNTCKAYAGESAIPFDVQIEVNPMTVLVVLFVMGWLAVSIIGTQAYFLGEQTKPIHERNWRSDSFEAIAQSVTGKSTSFRNRVPGFTVDAYASSQLPTA